MKNITNFRYYLKKCLQIEISIGNPHTEKNIPATYFSKAQILKYIKLRTLFLN